jgi:N-acetyl-1-D-myo-inositol-2-amino-2-deoxy-alpha-D-glucopyranoside deacetylase
LQTALPTSVPDRPAAPSLVVPATDDPFPPSVVDDEAVTHAVVDRAARGVQNDALRAHATQVIVASEDVHALSNLIAARTAGREGFRRVDPLTWDTVGGVVEPGEAGLLA